MTSFAETLVTYPDDQLNVYSLPESVMANGFIPKQSGVRGMPLPANWLNWLFREVFRKINRDKVIDGLGVNAVTQTDCFITVHAMVKTDPTKFIHAIGYKTGSGVPVFKTISNATLTLGTATATNIPISGATSGTIALRVTVSEAL